MLLTFSFFSADRMFHARLTPGGIFVFPLPALYRNRGSTDGHEEWNRTVARDGTERPPPAPSRAVQVCFGMSPERHTSKFMGYCWNTGRGFCTLDPLNTERTIFGHWEIFRHLS